MNDPRSTGPQDAPNPDLSDLLQLKPLPTGADPRNWPMVDLFCVSELGVRSCQFTGRLRESFEEDGVAIHDVLVSRGVVEEVYRHYFRQPCLLVFSPRDHRPCLIVRVLLRRGKPAGRVWLKESPAVEPYLNEHIAMHL